MITYAAKLLVGTTPVFLIIAIYLTHSELHIVLMYLACAVPLASMGNHKYSAR